MKIMLFAVMALFALPTLATDAPVPESSIKSDFVDLLASGIDQCDLTDPDFEDCPPPSNPCGWLPCGGGGGGGGTGGDTGGGGNGTGGDPTIPGDEEPPEDPESWFWEYLKNPLENYLVNAPNGRCNRDAVCKIDPPICGC